jgi:hypothetical protein
VAPIVNGLEQAYAGRVRVVRVNVHNRASQPLQERFGFTATPELFLVDRAGAVLGHWDEIDSLEGLKSAIDRIMAGKS